MKVLIKDLSDRRAEADGVILIFLVDADLDVDCGACTGLQSAADKPARLTIVPDTTCQIRYKNTNSGEMTLSSSVHLPADYLRIGAGDVCFTKPEFCLKSHGLCLYVA